MKIDAYDGAVLERIREICQELFHKNYITEYIFAPNEALKKANESFSFVMTHYDAIEELLERCGWKLCQNTQAGVLYLSSEYAPAKVILTKMESYFLLAIRVLYEEKKTQASASGEVFITTREIVEWLTTLGAVEQVTKQDREKALQTLAKKNIIARMTGKLGEMDAKLAILPSVVCALSAEKMKAVVNMLAAQAQEQEPDTAAEDDEI